MPSQKILEWCTTSINSIQQSVQQMVSGYTKPGLQVPPDIMQIQELSGQKPGEKFKTFNAIVDSIVESVKMGVELESNLCEMNPILLNLVKANVGVKLRLSDFIVESLKSEDSTISRKALDAHWFFEGDNPNVTVEFFTRDILPFVSVRTRLYIVKRLARGLQGHEIKAQQFFTELAELYGVEENLRILCACSESFIFDAILQNKIVVPLKILKILYSKYPNLGVQYLQLGNKNNTGNADSRKVHEIDIHHYDVFLPELIRQHPQAFVELYELTPEKILDTLSCHRSTLLLTNAKQQILSRPDVHLKLLQPKIVKLKLTPAEIETMLENYLPKDITDFSLDAALEFLDNYLGSEKIQVLLDKFQKVYDKNLLDHTRKIIGSNAKATRSGLKLLRKLAPAEREIQVRILLRNADEELKNVLMCYLNTAESLAYFKDKLSKSTGSADDRAQLIGCMLVSCGVNNSKKDLLAVLQHFQERHANEQKLLLCQFLQYLKNEFDLKSLEETHWSVLRNIVLNAHARKELFANVSLIESVLEAMLHHAMTRKRRDDRRVEEAMDLMVECKLENFWPSWNVMEDDSALEKECLEMFFSLIPVKYPMEQHHVWKKKNDRLAVALSLLKSINSFNVQNAKKRPLRKINLRDYPWILKLSEEFISREETGNRKEVLVKILKQQAPDFYEVKVNESSTILDIGTGEALHLLKRQPDRILADWEAYLLEARNDLQGEDEKRARAARSFVGATRWHHTLPVKFVEACLADHAKSPGSLAVLGILLPGEMFDRVAVVHAPTTTTTTTRESFEMSRAVVRAAKWTNPPVSLASLRPFCALGLADGAISSLAMRASPASVAEFADQLLPTRQARRGVRVARIAATRRRFREVLARAWSGSRDPASRRQLARAIFKLFVEQQPNPGNWELVAACLRALSPDEREILQELSDIERVHPTHLSSYVDSYLGKAEELFEACMDFKWRTRCVCLLLESFDERVTAAATDELLARIVERYFFDAHCAEISRAARTFALRYYLMGAAGNGKFEARLSATMGALRKMLGGFDSAHPKRRRFYPANYSLREFFEGLLTEMCFGEGDAETKLRVVRSVMEAFDANLSPWQEPASYVSLNLYREFLQSTSPEDFGARSAKRIAGMVEDFSSTEFVADVADCLSDLVVTGKIFREQRNALGLKMAVIDGLMRGDEYYGALTAAKMLDAQHATEYDERYDGFIATLRQMKNSSVQYNLYKHINNLGEQ